MFISIIHTIIQKFECLHLLPIFLIQKMFYNCCTDQWYCTQNPYRGGLNFHGWIAEILFAITSEHAHLAIQGIVTFNRILTVIGTLSFGFWGSFNCPTVKIAHRQLGTMYDFHDSTDIFVNLKVLHPIKSHPELLISSKNRSLCQKLCITFLNSK